MLNSAIFGGASARAALEKAMFDDELNVGTDWCVGGCTSFEETEEGRRRFNELRAQNEAWKKKTEGTDA